MTSKISIEDLRKRHLSLLGKSKPKELGKETLQEIETFLADVRNSGTHVFDSQQRDMLRSFLLYWGNFVYEKTGNYPDMKLEPYSGKVSRWPAWAKVAVFGVLILSLVIGFLIRSYLPVRQPLTVRILQPRNGDSVPYEIHIRGDYRGSLGEQNLWVIVYPHGSRYYPQQSAEIRGDNTWVVTAHLGEAPPKDSGKVFDVSVYLANSEADQTLQEYIDEAKNKDEWPGMSPLADGLTLLDRVTVTRR